MSEFLKRKIVKLLKHAELSPTSPEQLAKDMDIDRRDLGQFNSAVEQLLSCGHLVMGTGELISLPPLKGKIVGLFRANARGFGFISPLEPNSHGDLFIPAAETAGAMTGDIVSAKVIKRSHRTGQMRFSGKITEILERAENKFVGTLKKEKGLGWLVRPEGSSFFDPICIDDIAAKNAGQNDKCVVEILNYPTGRYLANGVITKVLGKTGRYDTEIQSIIHQYHLPGKFNPDCIRQARSAADAFHPDKADDRQDITDKVIITIDPASAKDFDDAISLEANSRGNPVLGIHIADVSSFVGAGSSLDEEAKERGNSVYLPGKTIPMLSEVLSNGICSLQPGRERFCKSVYLTYDSQGNILSRHFANSLICSTQRLTYQQAEQILDGRIEEDIRPEAVHLLKKMEALSRSIEQRRIRNAMLHLDLAETELIMDGSGMVSDARPADDSYPHTIIEMFMVEANEAVASLLDRVNVAFMRRIHPPPEKLRLNELAELVNSFGMRHFGLGKNPGRREIQRLLGAVRGTDFELAVNLAVLRSLEKARYCGLHIGHYALGSENYCHFTSPIRRYADLLVHRLLDKYIRGQISGASGTGIDSEQDLGLIGSHISFTEQRGEDAEREMKKVLILQLLSGRIGSELDCVLTGLTGFGVFAQSKKFGIEGLIPMELLGRDKWQHDRKTHAVRGIRSGTVLRLGQPLKAKIDSVNIPARQLNLVPAEPLIKSHKSGPAKKKRRRRSRKKT